MQLTRHVKPRFDSAPARVEFGILAEFFFHRIELVLLLDERFVITNLHLMFLLCDDGLG